MSAPCTVRAHATGHELRFAGLSTQRCDYSFPCDKTGLVDINALTDRCRADYFYARTMVGKELSAPVVATLRTDPGDNEIASSRRDERELAQ